MEDDTQETDAWISIGDLAYEVVRATAEIYPNEWPTLSDEELDYLGARA